MAQHPYDQQNLRSPAYVSPYTMQQPSAYAPQTTVYSQGNPQQYLHSPPQDWQRQNVQPVYHAFVPQPAAQVVVAPHFCAPVPTTFFMSDKLLSWSGDATILNESGQVAFLVSGKIMSLRGSRILKDAAGNPVCAMKEKVYSNLIFVFNKETGHNCLQHTTECLDRPLLQYCR